MALNAIIFQRCVIIGPNAYATLLFLYQIFAGPVMTNQGYWIVGAGGLARGAVEALATSGTRVAGLVTAHREDVSWFNGVVIPEVDFLARSSADLAVIAVGDNALRESIVERYATVRSSVTWVHVIDKSAMISPTARIGGGAIILAGAIVAAQAVVGRHALIYSGCVIEHDCTIGDFASFGPAAALGGEVTIGRGSFIGLGARVGHGRSIGMDSVVGMGSVVTGDLPDSVVAYGTPCRAVRSRRKGDRYL